MQVIGVKSKDVCVRWHGQSFHVSLVACGNAAGKFLHPTLIFEGVRPKSSYVKDFPEARLLMTLSGYMEIAAYIAWAEDFVAQTGGNCVLIVDNHSTRKSLAALEIFLEHKVQVVTLPPHTTHLTQPLDVAVFRPFKASFCAEVTKAEGSGEAVTKYRLSGVVKKAWDTATASRLDPATGNVLSNLVSGFEAAGIVPLNPGKVIRPDVVAMADRAQASKSLQTSGGGSAAAGAGAVTSSEEGDDDNVICAPNMEEDVEDEDDEAAPLIAGSVSTRTAAEMAAADEALFAVPEHIVAALKAHNAKNTTRKATSMTSAQLICQEMAKVQEQEEAEDKKRKRKDGKNKEAEDKKRRAMVEEAMKPSIPPGFAGKGWTEKWDDQKGPGLKLRMTMREGDDGKRADLPCLNLAFKKRWEDTGKHGSNMNH